MDSFAEDAASALKACGCLVAAAAFVLGLALAAAFFAARG